MISFIVENGATLFDSLLAAWFLTKFNNASWRRNFYLIPAILIPFVFQLLADRYLVGYDLLCTLIQFLLSLGYALLISKKRYFRAFCSACVYKVALIVLSTLLYYVFAILFENFDILLYGNESTGRYIYIITHKVLLLAILQFILHFFDRENGGRLLSGLLTFLFSLITVLGLGFSLKIVAKIDPYPIRYELLAITGIFFVLNLFLYILLNQLAKLQKRNYELKLLGEKSKFEESKYQEALATWQSAERIRHDVKHHMAAILGMIDDGNTPECRKYIEEYLSDVQKGKKFSRSGNTVIDYLLDSKLSPLENTQIIVTGSVGSLSDIRDTDLASLIGNILDNAVEAQKNVQIKRIELHFVNQNDNRMIICKNAVEKSVLKENRNLISTKSGSGHGYGHQIVAEIVKKYNGLLSYFEESDLFGVQIVLPKSAPM